MIRQSLAWRNFSNNELPFISTRLFYLGHSAWKLLVPLFYKHFDKVHEDEIHVTFIVSTEHKNALLIVSMWHVLGNSDDINCWISITNIESISIFAIPFRSIHSWCVHSMISLFVYYNIMIRRNWIVKIEKTPYLYKYFYNVLWQKKPLVSIF